MLVTYWQYDKVAGLKRIIDVALGRQMTTVLDLLARNAYLSGAFKQFGVGTGTGLDSIVTADKLSTPLIDGVHLGMAERNVPYAINPMGIQGAIYCITTPGALYDLRAQTDDNGEFLDVMKYADPSNIVANEVGTYHNTRFIQSNDACLYNCGPIDVQYAIKVPISAGDGAPAPSGTVDGAYKVGQAAATAYIELEDFSADDFRIGDIVTIHVDRTSANGVTNGVDFTDGKLHNRRIVALNASTNRLTFNLPIMEDFTTDLGGTVYGYVTRGRNVHTALFIGGNDGVVMGVSQPPRVVTPRPVDDFEEMQRFSWKGYLGFQVFEPTVFEVAFLAGTNRTIGAAYDAPH